MTSSPQPPLNPSMKTEAAASDERESVPMLKSTRWICWRCALHWTTQIATAIASAARGPKSAAPASAPTALTEIEPSSSSSARASPTLTSAITARIPITSVDVPKIAPRMPAETPKNVTSPTSRPRRVESWRKRGPLVVCAV